MGGVWRIEEGEVSGWVTSVTTAYRAYTGSNGIKSASPFNVRILSLIYLLYNDALTVLIGGNEAKKRN